MPYSRDIAEQRKKYGDNLLRKSEDQLAAQRDFEEEADSPTWCVDSMLSSNSVAKHKIQAWRTKWMWMTCTKDTSSLRELQS